MVNGGIVNGNEQLLNTNTNSNYLSTNKSQKYLQFTNKSE